MAVVAIAQQIGSRGLELGGLIASRLHYPLLGPDEIAAEASRDYKITPEVFSLVDERQPGWWERLTTDNARLGAYFRAVILKHMSQCNVVVVGRSIPFILPSDTRHGLRIRAVAPLSVRVREVMREEKLDASTAERRVRHYDQEVRARIQHSLGADLEEPSHYDLIVNTATRPMAWFATSIVELAATIDREADQRSMQALKDACLSAQVRAALLVHPKMGHAPIDVEAHTGVVLLKSSALVPPWDELAGSIVRRVPGVVRVELQIEEPPMPLRAE
ncbi:MAG TPA: cytidylate kinase-like family protein [Candidatus Binataceae bacterium]|jgi:cytidylate kinase|nr:cytidylate kinase-like family protein [Candidatus Binataceae bacterium]